MYICIYIYIFSARFSASDIYQQQTKKECARVVSVSQGNTTNLFSHLKTHHKIEYDECREPVQRDPIFIQVTKARQNHSAIKFYLGEDMCPICPVSNVKHSPALDSVAFCDGIFILGTILFSSKSRDFFELIIIWVQWIKWNNCASRRSINTLFTSLTNLNIVKSVP